MCVCGFGIWMVVKWDFYCKIVLDNSFNGLFKSLFVRVIIEYFGIVWGWIYLYCNRGVKVFRYIVMKYGKSGYLFWI